MVIRAYEAHARCEMDLPFFPSSTPSAHICHECVRSTFVCAYLVLYINTHACCVGAHALKLHSRDHARKLFQFHIAPPARQPNEAAYSGRRRRRSDVAAPHLRALTHTHTHAHVENTDAYGFIIIANVFVVNFWPRSSFAARLKERASPSLLNRACAR